MSLSLPTKLDCAKILQAKYFTGENIPIYGSIVFIVESADGHVVAVKYNPAVPTELLVKLLQWKKARADEVDVIKRLQLQMVPSGYAVHPWTEG